MRCQRFMCFHHLQLGRARAALGGAQEAPSLTSAPAYFLLRRPCCRSCSVSSVVAQRSSVSYPGSPSCRKAVQALLQTPGAPSTTTLPPRPVPRKRLPAQSENSVGSMNSAHPLQIAPPSLSGRQGPPEAHGGHREQLSTYWNRSSWVEAALRGLEPGHSPASGLSFAISKVGW